MKKQSTDWYTDHITNAMYEDQELESIDIPSKLSIIKKLYAKWLIEIYNEMKLAEGRQVCLKGWQVASIKDAVEQGLSKLLCLDSFKDIDLMLRNSSTILIFLICENKSSRKF